MGGSLPSVKIHFFLLYNALPSAHLASDSPAWPANGTLSFGTNPRFHQSTCAQNSCHLSCPPYICPLGCFE
ncbi:hypothetical protein EV421DRAFT_1855700 [Armillaria borealis]|uniref:Secreted protein n=1 Tax=Armillaria borealis TaxID=47425 RepID=A0AA39IY32_9AGAR|nr:hypothetical protein EV421DRAFT_1855700 [Armillaria borealis]